MATISLCMIVKNEEDTLSRCLDSINDIVDEIIIVDTGSQDRTKEIALSFTPNVFDFEWIDDFSVARNYSFSKATMDYILWLDADDVILEEDRLKLQELKDSISPDVDAVMMKYNYAFDEHGNVTLNFFRERLLKRSQDFKWIDPIHEYLGIYGNIISTDICITHLRVHNCSGRNLEIFKKMITQGKILSPRNLFYYAKELYYNGYYDEAITNFNLFIDSGKGWVEDVISAYYHLSICYSLKNDNQNMLEALFNTFQHDKPRAEICCQFGQYFFDRSEYEKAIFWYELAVNLEKPKNTWGFILEDYWGFTPCIQLCVCYYRIGNVEESIKYNNMAAQYKPNNASVIFNKDFFENLKNENQKINTISRQNDLEKNSFCKNFYSYIKAKIFPCTSRHNKLTLSMIMKNEANRYLKDVLTEHKYYIDEAVIIDDGSTDNSVDLCREILKGIPLHIIRNSTSKFSNEIELRKQQWEETAKTNPDWILNLDADEMFEKKFRDEVKNLIDQQDIDLYCFRLYDFWDKNHYREDPCWNAHYKTWPFLLRYRKDFQCRWQETPQHCGRFPQSIWELPYASSLLRLKHYGWADPKDRILKYKRCLELDPGAQYGWKEQYDSILDENPTLIEWLE